MEYALKETTAGRKTILVTLSLYEALCMVKDERDLCATVNEEDVITEIYMEGTRRKEGISILLLDAITMLKLWDRSPYVRLVVRYDDILAYIKDHANMQFLNKRAREDAEQDGQPMAHGVIFHGEGGAHG